MDAESPMDPGQVMQESSTLVDSGLEDFLVSSRRTIIGRVTGSMPHMTTVACGVPTTYVNLRCGN